MTKPKRAFAIALVVAALAIVGGAAIVMASSGSAPAAQGQPDQFAEITTPTGPELPAEEIAEIAEAEARRTGEPEPTIEVGTGTLEQAMGTFNEGFSVPQPVTDPGYQRLLDTPVALVVLKGQHFTLTNAPVRKGSGIPSGEVLFLVIDSHRGEILGRGLPSPEALQHAEAASQAKAASAHAISFHAVPGTIAGILKVGGGPPHRKNNEREPTHAVIVKRGTRTVAVAHTNSKGSFTIRTRPGTYSLRGTVGSDCQTKTLTVKPQKTTRVTLICSIL